MTPRSRNILVGLFVVTLSLGMVAFVTWLGTSSIQQEYSSYLVYMDETVSGLNVNSTVKYNGVGIGHVSNIRIDPDNSNRVELELQVLEGTPIKTDSEAKLAAQGITGLQYIEITGGSPDAELINPSKRKPYPVIKAGKSTLSKVQDAIGPLLHNINVAIIDIREILKSTQPERISAIVKDIQTITNSLADRTQDLETVSQSMIDRTQDAELIAASLVESSQTLSLTLKDARQVVNNTNDLIVTNKPNVELLFSNLARVSEEARQLLETSNHFMASVDQQQIPAQLATMSQHLDLLIVDINQQLKDLNLGALGKSANHSMQRLDELTLTLNQTAEEADLVSLVDDLRVTLQEIQTLSRNLNTVTTHLQQNPSALIFGESRQGYQSP